MSAQTELRRRLRRRLVDSQKRLHKERAISAAIGRRAQKLEREALRDIKRLRRKLAGQIEGLDREIAEAEYLDALDRRRRAQNAYLLSRRTGVSLGV